MAVIHKLLREYINHSTNIKPSTPLERCSVDNLVYVLSSYHSEGTTETNKYIKEPW